MKRTHPRAIVMVMMIAAALPATVAAAPGRRLMNPWPGKAIVVREAENTQPITCEIDRTNGECLGFAAVAGHTYRIEPLQ